MREMRIALTPLCAGIIVLSGCASSQAQLQPATGTPQTASQASPPPGHFIEALFYAFGGSNGKMAIFKVSYGEWPRLSKLVSIPYTHLYGACSDTVGHVFVTQHGTSGAGEIIEFDHGGTTAVRTLTDPGMATACSYDRSSGNLAVANGYDAYAPGGPGPDIAVYTREKGTPTLYADPLSHNIGSCSYDLNGNLFIGGAMRNGHPFVLTELPQGSSSVKTIAIDGKIGAEYRQEDVHWHRNSLYVTSVDHHRQHSTWVYVLNVSGSTATVRATIKLRTVNPNEKATGPWTVSFGRYIITVDRIGVAGWILPADCTGTCYDRRGERHLLRIADGFVSVAVSAIRPDEGEI